MENKTATVKELKEVEPKKQKISVTYTLRAFQENIKKLYELELIEEKEKKLLEGIVTNAVTKYVTIN